MLFLMYIDDIESEDYNVEELVRLIKQSFVYLFVTEYKKLYNLIK